MKTKRITVVAVLAALYVVLGYMAINLRFMKLSFAGLPVVVGGLLLGPAAGLAIGGIGALLEQLIRYGITATTILWILPVMVRGLLVGWYAKARHFRLTVQQTSFIVLASAFALTLMNTVGIYIDSKIYGYYKFEMVFGMILVRLGVAAVTSGVYLILISLIMPRISFLREEASETVRPEAEEAAQKAVKETGEVHEGI